MATMLEWRRGQTEPYQLRATTICAVISLSLVAVVAGSILVIDGDMPILAYTCFTFGGSVLVLCAVLVSASLKVKRKESGPADGCDPPPPYKAAWGRDFYASRMAVEHQPAFLHPRGCTEQDSINFRGLSVCFSSSVPTPSSPCLSSPTTNPPTTTTVSPTSNATTNTATAVTTNNIASTTYTNSKPVFQSDVSSDTERPSPTQAVAIMIHNHIKRHHRHSRRAVKDGSPLPIVQVVSNRWDEDLPSYHEATSSVSCHSACTQAHDPNLSI